MEHDIEYWERLCPFELSDPDRKSLLTKSNAEWQPHTWADLKRAIGKALRLRSNDAHLDNLITPAEQDLGALTRWPTDMRKYVLWRREMKTDYPDISKFIVTQRLGWSPPTEQGFVVEDPVPFTHSADYKLLRNDWPYGVGKDIGHVVVWLKTRIPVNELGEPTDESARLIEDFVDRTFRSQVDKSNSRPDAEVIWFKNPTRWQSVRTLEHIHVLTKGVDDSVIERLTGQKVEDTIGHSWTSKDVSG